MSEEKIYNVLFICTGNSARSIMAEAILNREGKGRFKAYSAGSHPAGTVNPITIDILRGMNYPTGELHSKDWAEFDRAGAPELNFVFTVCDKAAGEVCPIWPGQPMTAHWGFPDPAAFEGADVEKRAYFLDVFKQIHFRIGIFISLPMASLDKLTLQKRLNEIGTSLPRSA
ncbi:MAG: arsenate reductase ArsC [Rhodospirillales bacterium]